MSFMSFSAELVGSELVLLDDELAGGADGQDWGHICICGICGGNIKGICFCFVFLCFFFRLSLSFLSFPMLGGKYPAMLQGL